MSIDVARLQHSDSPYVEKDCLAYVYSLRYKHIRWRSYIFNALEQVKLVRLIVSQKSFMKLFMQFKKHAYIIQ